MSGKISNESIYNQIIIIDNSNENLKLLSEILEKEGYTVIVKNKSDETLKFLNQKQPTLLLLDVKSPELNCLEVCRQLKADEITRDIPVIFMGDLDDKASMIAGFQVGGVDYISSPYCKEEVLAKVKNHISLYQKQAELKAQNKDLENEISMVKQAELILVKRMSALTQPLDDANELAFDELFNINDLQKLQDQFASAFGVASIITTPEGVPITQPSNFSNLCQQIIRKTEKGLKNCMHSDAIIGCQNPHGPTVMPCLSGGLMDAGASITVGGKHFANWLIGQIRNENTDEGKLKAYASEIGVDRDTFMRAYYEVAPMPMDQFQKIAEMLFTMAKQLSVISYQNIQQAQYINRKKLAEEALLESEERFRTILYSIGDGVITTDKEGKVKIMNYLAEQLTGWTQSEASGKLLEEVFNIVNEETRAQVEIPVRKVLREGVIVGLANHTVLIAKDGTEYPIADSGAPIRTEQGEIVGVVLVFRDQSEERKAEYALKESEKRFKLLYENAPLSYQSLDTNARLMDVNPTWLNTLGYTREEVIGRYFGDFMSPKSAELIKARFANFVCTGEIHDYQFEMVKKNGTHFMVSYDGKIGYDENGQFKNTHCIFTDITQRKLVEDTLRDSEFFFRETQRAAFIGSYKYDLISGFWNSSEVMDQIFGIDKEYTRDLEGWENLIHEEDRQTMREYFKEEVVGKQNSFNKEYRIVRKSNGETRWVNGMGQLNMDAEGKLLSMIGTIQDITDRKRTEESLRESEERYQAFVNANADMIFVKDEQLRYLMANDAMANFFDKTNAELINKTDEELADKKHIYPCKSSDLKVLELKSSFTSEEKLGDRIYETTKFPIQLSGHKIGIGGIIRDITESKISADLIKNERQLLRTVIDNLPVTIYVKDREGRKIIANTADLEIIGSASEKDVIGKTDLETFNGEIGQRGYEDDLKVIQSGKPVINREEVFFNKNGIQQWLLTSKIPLLDQKGNITGLVGIGRDITEQKKANETILKFSKSIEQSPSTIVITDVCGNIEYVNPKFTEVTGYTLTEVTGKNPRILKSGEMAPETYTHLWNTITSGEVWRGEFLNKKKTGELYWEWATMTSIKNEEGIITNYISIKEDISSRKKMEADLIVAKEKAEENDRLKSAFLANMSHEIRTPLNSIIGFSELLADPGFQSDQRYEFAQIITNSGNNLLAIISDIMDISKIEAGQVEIRKNVFSVKQLIQDIHNEYKIKAHAKGLELHIPRELPFNEMWIESDQTKVKQVLINFIGNALKFTQKGSIEIGVKVIGRSIQILVKDTGIGIPELYHERIFERFRQVEGSYTRKYGGNGLGLAISKSLIEMLGGTIGMKSKEGEGSLFFFTLPDVLI